MDGRLEHPGSYTDTARRPDRSGNYAEMNRRVGSQHSLLSETDRRRRHGTDRSGFSGGSNSQHSSPEKYPLVPSSRDRLVLSARLYFKQGVTKRCRLSLLTNSALVIHVQMRGEGGSCGVSASEYSCAHHVKWGPNKLCRSTSIFNLWFYVTTGTGVPR